MNREVKKIIYRDHDFKGLIDYLKQNFLYPEVKASCQYRKAVFYIKKGNFFIKNLWKLKWLKIRRKSRVQISLDAKIGAGFRLVHDGTRVIVAGVTMGEDCAVGVNVIIGYVIKENRPDSGVPEIGNRVYIGHNSTIVGKIKIGNDVLIAPNSYVNKNVPDNSIVIGNNVIIPKEQPSKWYIKLVP